MKERAAATAEPISHIVNTFYARVEVGWAHLIPTVDAIKRTLRRVRQKAVTIMTDFEKAAMNAFQRNFPSAEVAGCYFHLGQSVWRRIQNLGLAARYREDAAFAIRVRRFLALAFVPLADVHHYTRILLADEISKDDGLLDLAKYFQETYVGQLIHGDMEIPGKFPYQTWNMYQRVKDDLPRTNNALEGWHNGFARMLPDHPQLPLLAAKYQKEQHKLALNREHHAAGRKHPSSQKKYQLVNKKIKSLITKLETYTLVDLQYLDQIAKLAIRSNLQLFIKIIVFVT
ncbi:uncharacterized protein [Penaeus vannamei]|uniref:uncharacterized protein n=1 Tax=Penaeus vannamei TaxID=6689 RepID=UPI00387F7393